jgi:hypothetical protein
MAVAKEAPSATVKAIISIFPFCRNSAPLTNLRNIYNLLFNGVAFE